MKLHELRHAFERHSPKGLGRLFFFFEICESENSVVQKGWKKKIKVELDEIIS
jgi:hypothetical protein